MHCSMHELYVRHFINILEVRGLASIQTLRTLAMGLSNVAPNEDVAWSKML